MADREGDQNDVSAQDCSSSIPNHEPKEEPCEQPPPAEPLPRATSQVRNSVLEEIAAHQAKRITELERTLEKKRATIKRLSAAPPLPHPAIPMVPPTAMPIPPVSTGTQNGSAQTASVGAPQASMPTPSTPIPIPSGLPPHSQPQSLPTGGAHNPAMAAPMVGFPPPQPHLAAGYPYMFPPPDPSFAAPYMGVVPPAVLHPLQPPQSRTPRQGAQKDKTNDGSERKQSRYWTPDEHERFLAGVKACGPKNYLQISEYVGTRNAKQVRTHAQKFQKRREREEAKLRNDMRHGRTEVSPMASVGAAAKAVVEAAAEAAMQGKVPGAPPQVKDSDSVGTQAGPSSCSSGKQCHSSNHQSQGASSAEGSVSTNTAAERNAENSGEGHPNSTSAAAVAAVAAEAVALGRGALPSGALQVAPKVFLGVGEKVQEDTADKSIEAERPKTEAVEVHSNEAETRTLTCDNSGQRTDECPQANKSATEGMAVSLGRIQTSGTRVDGVSSQACTDASTAQIGLKQKESDTNVPGGDEEQCSAAEHECRSDQNEETLPENAKHMRVSRKEGKPCNADGKDEAVATKDQTKEVRRGDGENGKQGGATTVSAQEQVEGTVHTTALPKSEPKCVDALTNCGARSEGSKSGGQRGEGGSSDDGERRGAKDENKRVSGATCACGEQGGKAMAGAGTDSKKTCEEKAGMGVGSGYDGGIRGASRAESQRKAGSEASMKVESGDSAQVKAARGGGDEAKTQVEKGQAEGRVGGGSQRAGHNEKRIVTTGGRKRGADEEDERVSKRARREEGSEGKKGEMTDDGGGEKGSPAGEVAQNGERHGGRAAANGGRHGSRGHIAARV